MTAHPTFLPRRTHPLPPLARRVLGSAVFEALATPHGVSHYLEQLSPVWSLDATSAVVQAVTRHPDAVTLRLRRAAPAAAHRAGQHVRLTVEIDGRSHTRCYSITDAEGADPQAVTLTIRTHTDGCVSRHLAGATPGLGLHVSEPAGRFVLPAVRPDRILLVSGGSGITPVLSMLRTLVAEGHRGRVTFLHYVRSEDAVLHADELAALARAGTEVDVVTVFTRGADRSLSGHLTRAHLEQVAPDWRAAQCFACGPIPMLETLAGLFEGEGLGDHLHRETFAAPVPAPAEPDGDAHGTTRFAASGVAAPNDGKTLLVQAEDAGLAPASGCRMGICHTCTRRLRSGAVRDVRTGAVSDTPDRDVQLCVSVAVGDVEIDL